ncbi:MAG: hypothetical protein JWP94_2987 [Mucilaginibacter sp.]|nr:hypothetical protein [Mucilaginibacter sp.]
MIADDKSKGIRSFQVIQPNNLVNDITQYIEKQLPLFVTSAEFIDITKVKKNENQHSTAFCVYMTNNCKNKFYFNRENAQKGSSTIDIGVYSGSKLIFTIEAKVLPTPEGTSKNPRLVHEYVYGKGAGIQRFKTGHHGLDDWNNLLSENGMIAYIKEKGFTHWHIQVNQWITDALWPDTELLQKVYFNQTAKLMSKHVREDHTNLTLHHFWINV